MTGVPARLEFAYPAPDRTKDPLSWDWVAVTDETQSPTFKVRRGRASSGSSSAQPGSLSPYPVSNASGDFTPGNPMSTYYPDIGRGTPVRVVVTAGDPYLALTGESGSRASTPDAASLDITGDLALAVQFQGPIRMPLTSLFSSIVTKWNETGNQCSYRLHFRASDNAAQFQWTTLGTIASRVSRSTPWGVPCPDAGPFTLGLYLDVNDGASGHAIHWYWLNGTIADLVAAPADFLRYSQTESGTTSIFAGTATLCVGDNNGVDADVDPIAQQISAMYLRAGTFTSGTVAANPDFSAQSPGATSFSDTAGTPKTWTITSPARITDDSVRLMGELAAVRPEWPGHGVDGTERVIWEVAGPLRRMRQGDKPLHSALHRAIVAPNNIDNVIAYWPWEDGSDATQAASPVAGVGAIPNLSSDIRMGSDATLNSSSPLPNASSGWITWDATVPPGAALSQFRVDLLVNIQTEPAAGQGVLAIPTSGSIARWELWISAGSGIELRGFDSAGTMVINSTVGSDPRLYATWAIYSLNVEDDGAGGIDWSFNIVPIPLGSSFGVSGNNAAMTVGRPTTAFMNHSVPPDGISWGHLIVTTGLGLGWLAPADTAYVGEPAGTRFARLCREQGIPFSVDGLYGGTFSGLTWDDIVTAGAEPMGPQRPLPLLTLLDECARTEFARFGESRELLGLTYRTRHENQAPALTVTTELTNPLRPSDDDQDLVNDVTVTRTGGSSYHLVDEDSIAQSGIFDDSRTVNTQYDTQLGNIAAWVLHEALWPEMRTRALELELSKVPAQMDVWAVTGLGDVVRATTVPNHYPGLSIDQIIDGYTEEVGATRWRVVVNGKPAGPWTVAVLDGSGTTDTDLTSLDSAATTLGSGITSSGTSLSLVTAAGNPLWTTAAAQFPLDVEINGERMTLSGITGAASPQTGTVSARSVNGVVRAHDAGSEVHVADPFVLSL